VNKDRYTYFSGVFYGVFGSSIAPRENESMEGGSRGAVPALAIKKSAGKTNAGAQPWNLSFNRSLPFLNTQERP